MDDFKVTPQQFVAPPVVMINDRNTVEKTCSLQGDKLISPALQLLPLMGSQGQHTSKTVRRHGPPFDVMEFIPRSQNVRIDTSIEPEGKASR